MFFHISEFEQMNAIWIFLCFSASVLAALSDETCDSKFFGRPVNSDCKAALMRLQAQLPEWDIDHATTAELLGEGATSQVPGPSAQNIQTPLIITVGR